MRPLENGTIIDCDFFSAIVVREDLLLVFTSELPEYASEGGAVELLPRGSNMWCVNLRYCDDLLITRDFNGVITADWIAEYWDDYEWDDFDFEWLEHEWLDAFDDYRSLSSPARIPRADRAFACRYKWGGRLRR